MKKKSGLGIALLISTLIIPVAIYAQTGANQVTQGVTSFAGIVNAITGSLVTALIGLFSSAALAAFFFGIVQYIWGVRNGEQAKITSGNKFMVYSIVALFVMFSIWGIIWLGQSMFGIEGRTNITIPSFEFGNGTNSNGGTPGLPSGSTPGSCATGYAPGANGQCVWVGGFE